MDASGRSREVQKQYYLKQLAELMIEEQVEAGVFLNTPHYSIIERQAMTLGRELSCQAQERALREVAACSDNEAACPQCGKRCSVEQRKRTVTSVDGPVELLENVANCRKCRRSFFPSADRTGSG